MKNGEIGQHLSTLLKTYSQLDKLIADHFTSGDDFARNQAFPYAIFESNADYLAFTLAFLKLYSGLDPNKGIVKGTYAIAHKLYNIAKKFVEKISQFDGVFWTFDTFKMFMAQDENMEEEMKEVVELILSEHENNDKN
ncbi:hypothetical protein HNY73_001035 [Argiope bruennichi]|uniref:Uncharacterized protein n=1 Tax=Argiope bruennichi TaxID=94029 RepID=A0A8T0G499_ARGBR|nr:hypothetical protein HNY73_001035 [Argiope bruennichi]